MTTLYPEQIDNSTTLPIVIDNVTNVDAAVANALRDAIIAVEETLGTTPESIYGTVRARLDFLESVIGGEITTGGDLSGPATNATVIKIQGRSISNAAPSNGDVLTWVSSGSNWSPQPAPIGFTAGGDLSGTATSQQVIKLTGSSGLVNIPTSSLEFGSHSTAATTGLIRLQDVILTSQNIIVGRNNTNTANLNIIKADGGGNTIFGDAGQISIFKGYSSFLENNSGNYVGTTVANTIQISGLTEFKSFGAGGPFTFDSDSSLTEWTFLLNGGVPAINLGPTAGIAQSGILRVGDVQGSAGSPTMTILAGRNHIDSADIGLITTDGWGTVTFGNQMSAAVIGGTSTNVSVMSCVSGSFQAHGSFNSYISYIIPSFKTQSVSGPFTFDSIDTGNLTEWLFKVDTVPSVQIKPNDIRMYVGASSPTVYKKISDGGVGWYQEDINNGYVINAALMSVTTGSAFGSSYFTVNSGVNNDGEFMVQPGYGLSLGGVIQNLSGTNYFQIFNGTAPSTTPTNSGALYVESGVLKYLDTTGTVTTIAPGGGGGGFTAGGDLSGTSTSQQVISLTGASNIVNVPSPTALEFGTHSTAATTGYLRTQNGQVDQTVISARNPTNSADVPIVSYQGSVLIFGGTDAGNTATFVDARVRGTQASLENTTMQLSLVGGAIRTAFASSTLAFNGAFHGNNPFVFDSADNSVTDWTFKINASRHFNIHNDGVVTIDNLSTGIVHADSSGNLTSSTLVNADVSGSAAIAVSKLANGTSAQILLNNSTPAPTWTTVSGDVAVGNTGSTAVLNLTGSSGTITIASTGALVQWNSGVSSPTLKQADLNTNSGTGQTLKIQAQNETGTTSTGGDLVLTSGTGTTAAGALHLQAGGADLASLTTTTFSLTIPNIKWISTAATPTINQTSIATSSATGQVLTIQAQNATGTTSTGGDLTLTSGTGTTTAGTLHFQTGGTDIATITPTKFNTKKGINRSVRVTAISTTVTTSDDLVLFSATGQTATLPSSPSVGDKYTIGLSFQAAAPTFAIGGGGKNIITGNLSQATLTITVNSASASNLYSVIYDGTQWDGFGGM